MQKGDFMLTTFVVEAGCAESYSDNDLILISKDDPFVRIWLQYEGDQLLPTFNLPLYSPLNMISCYVHTLREKSRTTSCT